MQFEITQNLMPSCKNRPGTKIVPTAIVSHRTGNPGSTAADNRLYWINSTKYNSAHYLVDENIILQTVPDNEMAYHVEKGWANGVFVHPNDYAIGIEFCEPYTETKYLRYVWLHAYLANKYNIVVDVIKPHSFYDPVNRPNDTGDLFNWDKFINDVLYELKRMGGGAKITFTDIEGHWAETDIEYLANLGFITGYESGEFCPDKPMTRAEACTALAKLVRAIRDIRVLGGTHGDTDGF